MADGARHTGPAVFGPGGEGPGPGSGPAGVWNIPKMVHVIGTPGAMPPDLRRYAAEELLLWLYDHEPHSPSLRAVWGDREKIERYTIDDIIRTCEDLAAGRFGPIT